MENIQRSVLNPLGQPIGLPMPNWKPPAPPQHQPMNGRFCALEPFDARRHAPDLYRANSLDGEGRMWTYLPYGPFEDFASYATWLDRDCLGDDPLFFTIVDQLARKPVGMASYLRIDPPIGSIEVGHLIFSPLLQKTPAATEAMYLMMKKAFEQGYRRYEWKCDALNAKSRVAAQRLGFSFEGIFRQARVYKGRTRDTAWFSVIDEEWPALEKAFLRWLDPGNFDERGIQRLSLSSLTTPLLKKVVAATPL
jgi:RimJ/RimL family protein N-acetyltransferase